MQGNHQGCYQDLQSLRLHSFRYRSTASHPKIIFYSIIIFIFCYIQSVLIFSQINILYILYSCVFILVAYKLVAMYTMGPKISCTSDNIYTGQNLVIIYNKHFKKEDFIGFSMLA